MNDSKVGVLALAVGGAAVGAAAGALVVSLLSSPPAVAPTIGERPKVTITLQKESGKCKASFPKDANGQKIDRVAVDDYEPGVTFEIFNENCDEKQVFRLREKRSGANKRPVPARCRFYAVVTEDLNPGQSVDPFPVCDFPLEKRYKGTYEYVVQLCKGDETGCENQDPEIEVKRR